MDDDTLLCDWCGEPLAAEGRLVVIITADGGAYHEHCQAGWARRDAQ